MAFTCLESWDGRQCPRGRAASGIAAAAASPMIGEAPARYLRKGSASLLSAAIHLLLIWLFINKLTGEASLPDAAGGSGEGLTIIDLSAPSAVRAAVRSETQPILPAVKRDPLVDTTVATDLPPPEWSVVRIVAPPKPQPVRIAAAPAASGKGAATGSGGASGASGSASGSGEAPYDPFAGAAPLRREPAEARMASLSERLFGAASIAESDAELILDREALDRIAREIAANVRGARGTAELIVRVSPQGVILAAKPGAGSASARTKLALTKALIGRPLFRPRGQLSKSQTLRLPLVTMG